MTRINVGIDPKTLKGKHLIAEHRELKRIPNAVRQKRAKLTNIPTQFTLGTGHVKFFYNKLGYLLNRYKQLHAECLNRNYNVTDFSSAWEDIPTELMNDWKPTDKDREIIIERLRQKDSFYDDIETTTTTRK